VGTSRRNPKSPQHIRERDFRAHSLAESFLHAWDGLSHIYNTQRNMRIHIFIASLVFSACIILGLDRIEFLMVTLAILGVLSAEVLNTLTESLVDLIEPEYNLVAKIIKDVAAAGFLS
jgi:diacylglycerol kinase (ATP)